MCSSDLASGLPSGTLRRSTVALRVAPGGDGGVAITSVAPRDGALPVWLAGLVAVQRGDGTVVVSVDGGVPDLDVVRGAATARATVLRTVPAATGDVVVVSPHTQAQTAQLVGQPTSAVEQVAAVTTQLDATGAPPREAMIVLNPAVYATMDQRAGQVVLSHEAAHLLTRAVGTRAEQWVVEGFADYVALRDDTAALSVSAGQILREVARGRTPTALPGTADFDSAGRGLGAVYESAWMVFRLLGERYGPADVVRFYESVIGGEPLGSALRDDFDLTERELTRDWRAYLTKSASIMS